MKSRIQPPPPMAASLVNIIRPVGSGCVPVRTGTGLMTGTGTFHNGFICAWAQIAKVKDKDPKHVWASTFPSTVTAPVEPLPTWHQARGQKVAEGIWHFDRQVQVPVPGAEDVAAAGGPNLAAPIVNRLVVWAGYETNPPVIDWAKDQLLFDGVMGTETQCNGGVIPVFEYIAQVPMNAPRQMVVEGKGFSGAAMQAFNQPWKLDISRGMHCVWDNGGDGKKTPRVELRLDIKQPTVWQLTFLFKRIKLVYLQSQNNWIWSRGNDLIFLGGDHGKKGVPLSLRVRPI